MNELQQIIEAVTKLADRVSAIEDRIRSGVSLVSLDKEHDRVMHEMKVIRETYGDHQSWSDDDKRRFRELKKRRSELRDILGIKY